MPQHRQIIDLADSPAHLALTATRIWQAFWQDEGVPLAHLTDRLAESLGPGALPFTLIAPEGAGLGGTVSVIAADLEERPALTPWLAALWVDPGARGQGLGTALVRAAAARAFAGGTPRLYLACLPELHGFYADMGWQLHETGIAGLEIMVLEARSGAVT